MKSLRISIFGLNYPPEPTGIAPYTAGLATGLLAKGHHVDVVCAYPHYPQWSVTPGYEGWTRKERIDGVNVRRVRHYVPRRPVGLRRAISEASFGARLVTSRWNASDVLVCVSPALISSTMTVARARLGASRRAVGLVMQDLYSAGVAETDAGRGSVERSLASLERWAICHVDGVSVIHERMKDRLVRSLAVEPNQVSVIRNWTHVPPAASFDRQYVRRELGWENCVVVLHAGAMGEKQSLQNVVEAGRVAQRRGANVLFVLLGDGGQRSALEKMAAGVTNVEFMDPLPADAYGRAMSAADVLLVNEGPGVVDMAVPSKLTSYFSTGVPVLAATDPRSATAAEIAASGAGVRINPSNPVALLESAQELASDAERAAAIGGRGPAYCARNLSMTAAIDAYEAWIQQLHSRATRR